MRCRPGPRWSPGGRRGRWSSGCGGFRGGGFRCGRLGNVAASRSGLERLFSPARRSTSASSSSISDLELFSGRLPPYRPGRRHRRRLRRRRPVGRVWPGVRCSIGSRRRLRRRVRRARGRVRSRSLRPLPPVIHSSPNIERADRGRDGEHRERRPGTTAIVLRRSAGQGRWRERGGVGHPGQS